MSGVVRLTRHISEARDGLGLDDKEPTAAVRSRSGPSWKWTSSDRCTEHQDLL